MVTLHFVALLCGFAVAAAVSSCSRPSYPWRVANSPYPTTSAGPNSPTTLTAFNSTLLTPTQLFTLQTLQGVVSRSHPALFETGAPGDTKNWWLADLESRFGLTVDASLQGNFPGLLTRFRSSVAGFVVCDVPADVLGALSYAAAHTGVIAVAAPDAPGVAALGIPQVADARNGAITPQSILAEFPLGAGTLVNRTTNLQDPTKFNFLSDWAVFGNMLSFFDTSGGLPSPLSQKVLSSLDSPAAVFGWGPTEGNTVDTLSTFGAYIHASDFANNLATLAAFDVPCLAQPSPPPAPSRSPASRKHTVTFLMTDGDNVQWLLGPFASGAAWYGSPNRGKVSLGWTVSPALAELAPSVLAYFYEHANPGVDEFVAGVSGVGYYIPEKVPAKLVNPLAALTGAMVGKADLSVVNILADEECDPSCTAPLLDNADVSAVFLYWGNAYVGRNGAITWTGGKPVVGGRAALWQGFNTPESLAQLLKGLPNDPRSADSYSLIPVHVWSRNVTDVLTTAGLLGSDFFDVLPPQEFVAKLISNVFHDCANAPTPSGPYTETCSGGTLSCGSLTGVKCSDGTGGQVTNPFFDYTVCSAGTSNCFGRLVCAGSPCSAFPSPSGSYAGSCSSCSIGGGFLTGCSCAGGVATNPSFDYTVCGGAMVANCFGALICQGQPCQ